MVTLQVTVLEEKKKEAPQKVSNEAEASVTVGRNFSFEKQHVNNAFIEEIQVNLNKITLHLYLCLFLGL